MNRRLLISSLDYLPPVAAFAAAVMAVAGWPTWNADGTGLARITPFGWGALTVGFLALAGSFAVTARNHRDMSARASSRERVSALACSLLLGGLRHTIHPIISSDIWQRQCAPPRHPADLLEGKRRDVLASLNLNSPSPYADGTLREIRWHEILRRAAQEGADRIERTLQMYANNLSPEILDITTRFLHSTFLQHRLLHMHDFVLANTHRDPDRAVPFLAASLDRMHRDEYEEFWDIVELALLTFGAEKDDAGQPLLLERRAH